MMVCFFILLLLHQKATADPYTSAVAKQKNLVIAQWHRMT